MTQRMENSAASPTTWQTLQHRLAAAVNPGELLMSPEEAAAYTGISVPALAMMRHRKTGARYMNPTPRIVRYRKRDIDAWLQHSAHGKEASAKTLTGTESGKGVNQ